MLGEHTDAVLTGDLGLTSAQVATLRDRGCRLMESSTVRKRSEPDHRRRQAVGGRASGAKRRGGSRLRTSSSTVRHSAVQTGGPGAESQQLSIHGVHARRERAADVRQDRPRTTSSCRSTRPAIVPVVMGHVSRTRGRRVIESERPIADKPVGELTEDDVLEFVLKEIAPFVER